MLTIQGSQCLYYIRKPDLQPLIQWNLRSVRLRLMLIVLKFESAIELILLRTKETLLHSRRGNLVKSSIRIRSHEFSPPTMIISTISTRRKTRSSQNRREHVPETGQNLRRRSSNGISIYIRSKLFLRVISSRHKLRSFGDVYYSTQARKSQNWSNRQLRGFKTRFKVKEYIAHEEGGAVAIG